MSAVALANTDAKKKNTSKSKSLRFDLILQDTTEDVTNEFSYAHLVNDALKRGNETSTEQDSLDGDTVDTKLARIARQLEDKYGSAVKKRRIIHDADFIDLGCGYDTDDSFVDDSEAIDDFVPPHVETARGGFYINQGSLEFKKSNDIDPERDYNFQPAKKTQPPKVKKPSQQKTLASEKLKKAKDTLASKKASILALSAKKTPSQGEGSKAEVLKTGVSKQPKSGTNGHVKLPGDGKEELSKTDMNVLLDRLPDVDLSSTQLTQLKLPAPAVLPPVQSPNSSDNEADPSQSEGATKGPPLPLPANLPQPLLLKITEMKEALAKGTAGDKKLSLKARSDLDTQMIEIEKACGSNINLKTRTAVYDHLAGLLNVKRSSIMSRTVRQLKKKEEEKLTTAIYMLQQEVDKTMAPLLEKYEEELVATLCANSTAAPSTETGQGDTTEPMDTQQPATVDEPSPPSTAATGQGGTMHSKVKKARRHFKWDLEMKERLRSVVSIKIEHETASQKKPNNIEEFVGNFLDQSIRPFWPKGWMSKRVLLKISEPVYKHLMPAATDQPAKKLQPSQAGTTSPSDATGPPSTTVSPSSRSIATSPAVIASSSVIVAPSSSTPTTVTSAAGRTSIVALPTTSMLQSSWAVAQPPSATSSVASSSSVAKSSSSSTVMTSLLSTGNLSKSSNVSKSTPPISLLRISGVQSSAISADKVVVSVGAPSTSTAQVSLSTAKPIAFYSSSTSAKAAHSSTLPVDSQNQPAACKGSVHLQSKTVSVNVASSVSSTVPSTVSSTAVVAHPRKCNMVRSLFSESSVSSASGPSKPSLPTSSSNQMPSSPVERSSLYCPPSSSSSASSEGNTGLPGMVDLETVTTTVCTAPPKSTTTKYLSLSLRPGGTSTRVGQKPTSTSVSAQVPAGSGGSGGSVSTVATGSTPFGASVLDQPRVPLPRCTPLIESLALPGVGVPASRTAARPPQDALASIAGMLTITPSVGTSPSGGRKQDSVTAVKYVPTPVPAIADTTAEASLPKDSGPVLPDLTFPSELRNLLPINNSPSKISTLNQTLSSNTCGSLSSSAASTLSTSVGRSDRCLTTGQNASTSLTITLASAILSTALQTNAPRNTAAQAPTPSDLVNLSRLLTPSAAQQTKSPAPFLPARTSLPSSSEPIPFTSAPLQSSQILSEHSYLNTGPRQDTAGNALHLGSASSRNKDERSSAE